MSTTPNPDPYLEQQLQCNGTRPSAPREFTTTPVEWPFTATQEQNQQLSFQEPTPLAPQKPEESIVDNYPAPSKTLSEPLHNIQPSAMTLDLQILLLALTRQANNQPKKRNKGIKEPNPFSSSSSDKLQAFIFQYQMYFHACEGEFTEDTKKIFFAISYLWGIALDYFKPFIAENDELQAYDFLEEWPAFLQKLSNLFGSYSPEDDDKDTLVAIFLSQQQQGH